MQLTSEFNPKAKNEEKQCGEKKAKTFPGKLCEKN